jgi:hypothetical protein
MGCHWLFMAFEHGEGCASCPPRYLLLRISFAFRDEFECIPVTSLISRRLDAHVDSIGSIGTIGSMNATKFGIYFDV